MSEVWYQGTFEQGVDQKRRLQVPLRFRPSDASNELTVVPWASGAGCHLRVFSREQMEDLRTKLKAIPATDTRKASLKRMIFANSEPMSLDGNYRGCIPERAAKAAGITNKAILLGCMEHWEIWSPERHVSVQQLDSEAVQKDGGTEGIGGFELFE